MKWQGWKWREVIVYWTHLNAELKGKTNELDVD